jgi:hypothetical protein
MRKHESIKEDLKGAKKIRTKTPKRGKEETPRKKENKRVRVRNTK